MMLLEQGRERKRTRREAAKEEAARPKGGGSRGEETQEARIPEGGHHPGRGNPVGTGNLERWRRLAGPGNFV